MEKEAHLEKKEDLPFDVLVVMTYASSPEGPSFESKMAAIAGVHAWQQKLGKKIVIVGEPEHTGTDPKMTTPDFMKKEMVSLGVPEESIEVYTPYTHTVHQTEKIKEIYKSQEIHSALIIALRHHVPRVEHLMFGGLDEQKVVEAEELLRERNSKYDKIIERWKQSPEMKKVEMRERFVLRPITYVDFSGLMQRLTAAATGLHKPLTHGTR